MKTSRLVRVAAALVVGRAALRTAFWAPREGIDGLVARLRRGRALPAGLRDAALLASVVDALAPHLPPRHMGACLKRSLLLLEVWSRCGLQPAFHLGAGHDDAGRPRAHAWLSGDAPTEGGIGDGFEEVCTL